LSRQQFLDLLLTWEPPGVTHPARRAGRAALTRHAIS